MNASSGLAPSATAQEICTAVQQWVNELPTGTVELLERPIPEFDEYGLERILMLRPAKVSGCPLELGVTGPTEGPGVYISIDTAGKLAQRLGLEFHRPSDMIVLYREPVPMSVPKVLEVCQAVSDGDVELTVGIIARRIVSTAGGVRTPSGELRLHGIEPWLPMLTLSLIHI